MSLSAPSAAEAKGREIFVSYRREDGGGWAGRLAQLLCDRFGEEALFYDQRGVKPTEDFVVVIEKAVRSCKVMVVVVDPGWVARVKDNQAAGVRDWVVFEVCLALRSSVVILPVLVGGARMPGEDDLPREMRRLARYHAIDLTDARWEYDSTRVVEALRAASVLPVVGQGPVADGTAPTRVAFSGKAIGSLISILMILMLSTRPATLAGGVVTIALYIVGFALAIAAVVDTRAGRVRGGVLGIAEAAVLGFSLLWMAIAAIVVLVGTQ